MQMWVCLFRFYAKTSQTILINLSIQIFMIKEKQIGHILLQKYNFKGVK